MDRCTECGFVYDDVSRDDVGRRLVALTTRYRDVLVDEDPDVLRAHPLPDVWSALEYACHMRDVYRVQRERVLLALSEEQPAFAPMRRDERVGDERYNEQDPGQVAQEIDDAAASLARTLESLDDGDWRRTGIYNYPERRVRTIEWIGRHTVHEGEHHARDIDRVVASVHADRE
ncbi:MAG TPA: DinB family protein [Acidimicrobiia bacterium]|nr:DinB family protein [Acidimicrobiia bacterium]